MERSGAMPVAVDNGAFASRLLEVRTTALGVLVGEKGIAVESEDVVSFLPLELLVVQQKIDNSFKFRR